MKNKKKSTVFFRRLMGWLHLWLGLGSGLIICIVCLTGALYTFQKEVKDVLEPWRFVSPEEADFIPPSQLLDTALVYMPGYQPTGLTYEGKTNAAAVGFHHKDHGKPNFTAVFMNPYTGKFITKRSVLNADGTTGFDFFGFVREGHQYLWLPREIGKYVVNIATLIFVISLLTGIVLWWPKKWKRVHLRAAFRIQWRAPWKKLNYDLHNVLGFYTLVFTFILAFSGLIIGLNWVSNSVYFLASAGEKPPLTFPQSIIPEKERPLVNPHQAIDQAWRQVMAAEKGRDQGMYISPDLREATAPIVIWVYHHAGSFYDRSTYYYDQYSLARIHTARDNFQEAALADKLMMLNEDVHTGVAFGWVGKIFTFVIGLIGASLPVTGALFWWSTPKNRRKIRFRDF